MCDSAARLGALMRGALPDRVPIICNMFDQGAREVGLPIREYYADGEIVAEAQIRMRQRYGYDNVWGNHYVARFAEMLGSKRTIFAKDGPPNVGHLIIKSYKDIDDLEIPEDFSGLPAFQEQAKTFRILKRELNGTCPVLGVVIAAFSMPPILMGMAAWLDLLHGGPVSVRDELLKKCSLFTVRCIRALREVGADMIAYSNPVASMDFITPAQFAKLALEWVARDFEAVGSNGLLYFTGGGRINPIIDILIERVGATAFYIHPDDDIQEAKNIARGRALIAAPINDIGLLRWDEAEIQAHVERIMTIGAPGGGFLFGTMVMPYNIPDEKIHALVKAAKRYGEYSRTLVQ